MATGDYYATTGNTTSTWANWATSSTADLRTNGTWYRWIDGTCSNPAYITQPVYILSPQLTPEQQKKRAEQAQKDEAERQHREQNRQIAEERALQLLLENLDENQKAIYETTKAIPVKVKSGRFYRINKGRAGNVEQVDEKGVRLKKLCFHPTENVPDFDVMLAQKLMLECCEEEVLRIANFS